MTEMNGAPSTTDAEESVALAPPLAVLSGGPLESDKPRRAPGSADRDAESEGLDTDDWPKVGMLRHAGYHVGQSAPRPEARRAVLRRLLHEPLPNVQDRAYMAEWGLPRSAQRLRKLADCLAALARNARRKEGYELAVRHWEADLAHVKQRYYDGQHD